MLFTVVLPKRLCKIHTPCIHYHLRDKIHRSHHGLIKRARLSPYPLLTLSPFPLFLPWRSPLPFCLLFLFPSSSISWAMHARGKYLVLQPTFFRLPRVRHSLWSHSAISRKVIGKNVHATIPKGNMGYV